LFLQVHQQVQDLSLYGDIQGGEVHRQQSAPD
jgi:hypothetical protein